MGLVYKTKILAFVTLLLTKFIYPLYYITLDFNNCDNILIEIPSEYTLNINEKDDSILYYACFFYKNGSLENCYKAYKSDFIVITSIGIRKINYKSFVLDYIPEKVVIKNYKNETICEASINSCIKDGICNNLCGYDEDCYSEKTIIDLEKSSENFKIELEKLPISLKIAIIILLIIIAILIWKYMK